MYYFKVIIFSIFLVVSSFAQETGEISVNAELKKDLPMTWDKDANGDEVLVIDHKIRKGMERLRVLRASMSDNQKAGSEKETKTVENAEAKKRSYSYYTVLAGENIQAVSKKLYGTTDRWKDLYLLNENQMKDGGVKEGMKLKYKP